MATAPSIPKERDEVLKRMIPYLRIHLRKMYARSAATSAVTEYAHAAMLLDNIVLDDYRSQYEKTLNRQTPPTVEPTKPRPRRHGLPLNATERAAIRDLVVTRKISPTSPAAICAAEEEE